MDIYRNIDEYLTNCGEVLTEHVGARNLDALGNEISTDLFIHDRDMKCLPQADIGCRSDSTKV